MEINRQLLEKIAHLARLEIEEKDTERMLRDMTNIISWVEKLNALNTDGVEPLTTMSHEVNVLREDKVGPQMDRQTALRNAPSHDEKFFRVPKVLE